MVLVGQLAAQRKKSIATHFKYTRSNPKISPIYWACNAGNQTRHLSSEVLEVELTSAFRGVVGIKSFCVSMLFVSMQESSGSSSSDNIDPFELNRMKRSPQC